MRARILQPTLENIEIAAAALRRGEVVGMPTETVYGLAGAALQTDALALIFNTKERPTFDPLIVHVGISAKGLFPLERLELINGSLLSPLARQRAEALIQAFWPGPLTLVLPKHEKVPELVTSGLPSIALRMPAHRTAQWLLAACGLPLAAPSANRFGRISPTTAQAVAEELGDRIDWILDGGPCEIGVESTVVSVEADGVLRLLRPGGLSRARIEETAGCPLQTVAPTSRPENAAHSAAAETAGAAGTADSVDALRATQSTTAQLAPGMLDSHYAPRKPLFLLPPKMEPEHWKKIAALAGDSFGFLLQQSSDTNLFASDTQEKLRAAGCPSPRVHALGLSASGDLGEIARNLFGHLRALDASPAQILFAETCGVEQGLGHAISDRLQRASRGQI